jgi:hypothetical protein
MGVARLSMVVSCARQNVPAHERYPEGMTLGRANGEVQNAENSTFPERMTPV